ncbi:DUF1254 domain-containing protein [Cellulomonas endometrii]|uniref:DUF1254 domain-containing protein n=1 Tax=Cellulomonas endometrii TaxID=3036301 RepID=UPI0024AE2E55|nr:DUF1254 domain-containing protein [Cellulomonas endometrii]
MVNMHNRHAAFAKVPSHGLVGGVMPAAPLNNITMLQDYARPDQRFVASPNQDVIYGFGILSLDDGPVVVQVPDFGDRFWVYQLGDQRTDGFGDLGQMYGSKPGLYLLAGPRWLGDAPDGFEGVFRSPTSIGCLIPRVFMDDTSDDREAVRPLVSQVTAYPLSEFTGQPRTTDWTDLPSFPAPPADADGAEVQWVDPERFFDVLPDVLREVAPLEGEEAIYRLVQSLLDYAGDDPDRRAALSQIAVDTARDLVGPLFQYSNEGIDVGHSWGTLRNAARFGTDYTTRTAAAKANIFANRPEESTYFFTDFDADEKRLSGSSSYTVRFDEGQLPPVRGFWSLTLYDRHHFFAPNELDRYSLGTKNKDLRLDDDGSLTIYVQHERPQEDRLSNWLPAPEAEFELFLRAYWPGGAIEAGDWAPPAVETR